MSIQSRTYCPRTGSVPACVIAYFQKNLTAKLTGAEMAVKFGGDAKNVGNILQLAIDAGFIARSSGYYTAGDDIDEAPDYGSVAKADATIKAAATKPNAPHNVFGGAIKPPRTHTPPTKDALPDPLSIELESGIPLPPGRGAQQDWAALLDRMSSGQSCALPKIAQASLAKVVALKHKTTDQKFAIRKVSETEIRLWRTA